MHTVIRAAELPPRPSGTVVFEGAEHGAEVSCYLVNNLPGEGPALHRHPYSETWFLRSGRASFVAGDQQLEAGPGDILVVEAGTPHKFTNIGDTRLEIICIHASPTFIQEDLE
jgi:mannose-6-phosphate isomerase-like protein (cupin superfamily)